MRSIISLPFGVLILFMASIFVYAQEAPKIITLDNVVNLAVTKDFTDRSAQIRAVAFSPNSTILASAGTDNVIHLWNVISGDEICVLKGHESWVQDLAFTPDGTEIASASSDKTVRLWDVTSCKLIQTLDGEHYGEVLSVSISHDGSTLVSGDSERYLVTWDIKTGKPGLPLEFSGGVDGLDYSIDGRLAVGTWDGNITVWQSQAGQPSLVNKLSGEHTDAVLSVAFSPDGKEVASASKDTMIKLWDLDSNTVIKTFAGHRREVDDIAFSPDGKLLISVGCDESLRIWNVENAQQIASFRKHDDCVQSVAFSSDGTRIATGGWDGSVKLWGIP